VVVGSPGLYNVTWSRAVNTCGYLVSVFGSIGGGTVPDNGEISAMSGGPNVVVVRTFGADGVQGARSFTISVVC
jgi:hypothetical protein